MKKTLRDEIAVSLTKIIYSNDEFIRRFVENTPYTGISAEQEIAEKVYYQADCLLKERNRGIKNVNIR